MHRILRTDSENGDFVALVKALDAYLAITDGDEHAFYSQYNKIDKINHVIVFYEHENPIGCGALKAFDDLAMEVKRMFVPIDERGKGIATLVLQELEKWCKDLNYEKCILETGEKQPEAVKLYQKNNYKIIPNYGQYAEVASSICFEKKVNK